MNIYMPHRGKQNILKSINIFDFMLRGSAKESVSEKRIMG